jgi:DNA modification methylase
MTSSVVMTSVEDLLPYAANARTHSADQVKRIAASIKEFGFNNPILVDGAKGIIAGHGRLEAARKLKLTHVPTIELAHLTDAQKRAYILADNRLALDAGWDDAVLAEELKRLSEDAFDLSLTGFSQDELDKLLGTVAPTEGLTDEDEVPEVPQNVHGVERGQVWTLGRHRLMCGDSTDAGSVALLMNGQRAALVHTDPPYNVDYSNADRPKAGKTDFGKIKNDSMDRQSFTDFLTKVVSNLNNFTDDNSTFYIWFAGTEVIPFVTSLENNGLKMNQLLIWKKPMLLGRSKYQWAHEPCLFVVKGSPYFTDDRTKTTVWDFGGYDKSKNVHPTQKPVVIPEEAINNSCTAGAKVLDLFGGSGSTLIACEKTGRTCFMMELDEHYCSVIIERWQQFTGQKAELVG